MDTSALIELPALHAAIWAELARAPRDKAHGWRVGTLATVAPVPPPPEDDDDADEDADGSGPGDPAARVADGPEPTPALFADARSVVLRDVDALARELLIYTDSRSPKVSQMQQHPQGTVLLWCSSLGWQLRLRVELTLHTSGLIVSSRWARLKMTPAAQDYLSPLPPGSRLSAQAFPEHATREHFAVVHARVLAVDWLELGTRGHRRARFDDHGARWVVP